LNTSNVTHTEILVNKRAELFCSILSIFDKQDRLITIKQLHPLVNATKDVVWDATKILQRSGFLIIHKNRAPRKYRYIEGRKYRAKRQTQTLYYQISPKGRQLLKDKRTLDRLLYQITLTSNPESLCNKRRNGYLISPLPVLPSPLNKENTPAGRVFTKKYKKPWEMSLQETWEWCNRRLSRLIRDPTRRKREFLLTHFEHFRLINLRDKRTAARLINDGVRDWVRYTAARFRNPYNTRWRQIAQEQDHVARMLEEHNRRKRESLLWCMGIE
jgi:predicted transcriptional regulator